MKFKLNTFLILLLSFWSCKQTNEKLNSNLNSTQSDWNTDFNFFPSSTTNAVYNHEGYSFSYAEQFEQAEWVAYVLEDNDIQNVDFKRPYFEVDPSVTTGSAHWKNYKGSGYDKGHLCPAGDRRSSLKLYEETFLTSNISPQKRDFNAGLWNRLEQKTRYWAQKYDGVYVITAGVLKGNMVTIGSENVAVPNFFYKVLMTKDKTKMIAFLIPHNDSDEPLYKYVVCVDELEKRTGIDFFPDLHDALENKLESQNNYKNWAF
jgi:endonuclease G, mitochondrial